MNLKDLTPKEIIDGVKNGTIESESFTTFEEYNLWVHGFDDILKENKKLKEKIGILLAESHIANEQITNMSFELEELKEIVEKIQKIIDGGAGSRDNLKALNKSLQEKAEKWDNARFKIKVEKKLESLNKQYAKRPTLRLKYQIGVVWGLLNRNE